MKLKLVGLLVLLSLQLLDMGSLSSAQTKSEDTSYDLYHACQDAVRYVDAPNSDRPGRTDYCFGYFEGYTNVLSANSSSLCIGQARIGTLIRVYLAYMDKNPKLLDDPKLISVTYALKESYSCPTKTDGP
jgi:hypothetical protein